MKTSVVAAIAGVFLVVFVAGFFVFYIGAKQYAEKKTLGVLIGVYLIGAIVCAVLWLLLMKIPAQMEINEKLKDANSPTITSN